MRPENDDRGYELPKGYGPDSGEEFTPWRPGDPSTSGEAPETHASADRAPLVPSDFDRTPEDGKQSAGRHPEQARTRWWTEESATRWGTGDKVRSRDTIRGTFMEHVPAGTRGRVVDKQMGALSGEWLTVEFENGYTEKVRSDALKRDGWF